MMGGPVRQQPKARMQPGHDYPDPAGGYIHGGQDWQGQDGQYMEQGGAMWQGGEGSVDEGQMGWEQQQGYGSGGHVRSPSGGVQAGYAGGQQWGPNGVPLQQQQQYRGSGGPGAPQGSQWAGANQRQGGGGDLDLYDSDAAAGGDQNWQGGAGRAPQQQYPQRQPGGPGRPMAQGYGTDEEQWYSDGSMPGQGAATTQGQGQRASMAMDLQTAAAAQKAMAAYKRRQQQMDNVISPGPMTVPTGAVAGMSGPAPMGYDTQPRRRPSVDMSPLSGNHMQQSAAPQGSLTPQQQASQQYNMGASGQPMAGTPSQSRPLTGGNRPTVSRSGRQVVQCEWCSQLLGVPAKLEPSQQGIQKLRCGKCLKVSKFAVVYPPDGGNPMLEPLNAGPAGSREPIQPTPGSVHGAPNGPASAGMAPDGYGSFSPQQGYDQYGRSATPSMQQSDGGYGSDGAMNQPMASPMPEHYSPSGVGATSPGMVRPPGNMHSPMPQHQQPGYAPSPAGYSGGAPNMGQDGDMLTQQMGRMQVSGGGMPPHQQQMGQYQQHPSQPIPNQQLPNQQQMYGGHPPNQHLQQYPNHQAQPSPGGYQGQVSPMPQGARGGVQASPMAPNTQWNQQGYPQGGGHPGPEMGGPHPQQYGEQGEIQGVRPGGPGDQGQEYDSGSSGPPRQASSRRMSRPASAAMPAAVLPRQGSVGGGNSGSETEEPAPPPPQKVVSRTLSMKKPKPTSDNSSLDDAPQRRRSAIRSQEGLPNDRERPSALKHSSDREEGEIPRTLSSKKLTRPPSDRLSSDSGSGKAEPSIRRVYSIKGPEPGDGLKRTFTERGGAPGGSGKSLGSAAGGTVSLNRSNTMGDKDLYNRKVIVNGQPVPDRLVASVEMRIGKIEAGKYWYDPRSGFWGPWGGPLFGAIPQGLKEFGSSLPPPDCSAGNANVFINGRQLQKKELSLLLKKGLPDFPGSRFTLDADGTVGDTAGRPIKCIGKLYDEKKRGMWLRMPGK